MATGAKHGGVKKHKAAAIDLDAEIAELHVLLRAVGEEAIMMRNGGKLAEKEKSYFGDIVTEADHLIEREIVKRIQARYPDHCVRGEESGPSKPEGSLCEYEWIVNPIDGTANFAKGLTFFATAITFLDHGVPAMGVLYFPELSRFVHAIKGGGIYDNGKMLKPFERPEARGIRHAVIAGATTRRKDGRAAIVSALRMSSLNLVNSGSTSYNGMLLAEGKLDAIVHTDASLFNIAALIPILEEAGCILSGFEEDYPDLSKDRIQFIAASNPDLVADIKKQILPAWEKAEK